MTSRSVPEPSALLRLQHSLHTAWCAVECTCPVCSRLGRVGGPGFGSLLVYVSIGAVLTFFAVIASRESGDGDIHWDEHPGEQNYPKVEHAR